MYSKGEIDPNWLPVQLIKPEHGRDRRGLQIVNRGFMPHLSNTPL